MKTKHKAARPRLVAAVLFSCLLCGTAWAETDTVTVQYLPLQEAADLVQSQLSSEGRVAQLPSRRVLVIRDDAAHIRQAKEILKRLDVALPQLTIRVDMVRQSGGRDTQRGTTLSGGWVELKAVTPPQRSDSVQLTAGMQARQQEDVRRFSLRVASGKHGHIEVGEVRTARPEVRHTLEHYGVRKGPDLALEPITAGFDVRATLLDDTHVRLHIRPWFRRMERKSDIQAKTEILLGLGSTSAPSRPPGNSAPMRANINPALSAKKHYIWVADAETEVVVKLGDTVELAAVRDAARAFSQTLLSSGFNRSAQTLRFGIRVDRAR